MNSFPIPINSGSLLADLYPERQLWKYWLGATNDSGVDLPVAFQATAGLKEVLNQDENAPKKFFPPYYAEQLAQDPQVLSVDAADGELIANNLAALVSGAARAVVTGQQPGFGGGPLYSLFKVATTVALARLRSARGLPSVPVFWLGDDDDDLAEALDPVIWDGLKAVLAPSHCPVPEGNKRQPMIGTLPFDRLEQRVGEVLASLNPADDLGRNIKEIYLRAKVENFSLSELNELLIRRVFRGSGLIILRGNDPRLHHHCADFYNSVIPLLDELGRVTGLRAAHLVNEMGVTPLGSNSLRRPLYRVEGNHRIPWDGITSPEDSSEWRCGVLLRSMLQDWLLKPAAVVVGPGELAYLSQLTEAYDLLALPRAPLVPRFFGWLVPPDLDGDALNIFSHSRPLAWEAAHSWALGAGLKAEDELVALLSVRLGVSPERARSLASGRTRRWVKGVQTMLQNESQRQVDAQRPNSPAWVFPAGRRQERKLAWVPCVATWGQGLVDCLLEACEQHLQGGLEGWWNEYVLQVQEPVWWSGKGENS